MKKQNLIWLLAIMFLTLGPDLTVAQEEVEPKPLPAPVRQRRMGEQPRPRARVSMTDPNAPVATGRLEVQDPSRRQPQDPFLVMEKNHRELIGQLTEIKKMAEEEGASKTAQAVQALIDMRNEEHRKTVEEMQNRRMEMQRRIQERISRRQQPDGSSAVTDEKTAEQAPAAQDKKQDNTGKKESKK
jgi:hypothetical protein